MRWPHRRAVRPDESCSIGSRRRRSTSSRSWRRGWTTGVGTCIATCWCCCSVCPAFRPGSRWRAGQARRCALRDEAVVLSLAMRASGIALRAAFSDADPRSLRLAVLAAQPAVRRSASRCCAHRASTRWSTSCGCWRFRRSATADARARRRADAARGRRTKAPRAAEAGAEEPGVLAALGALAAGWRKDPEVAPLLGLAASSTDAVLREAVARRGDGR